MGKQAVATDQNQVEDEDTGTQGEHHADPTVAEDEHLDPEEVALRDAEAAAEAAEQAAAGEGKEEEGKPGEEAGTDELQEAIQKGSEEEGGEKDPPQTVPVAAVVSERQARQAAERENAYLKGLLAGRDYERQNAQEKETQQEQQPTPEEELATIEQERLKIAEQYDDGGISAKEWEMQRQELARREREILNQQTQEQQQPAEQQPVQQQSDLALEEHLKQLVQNYPILNELSQDDMESLKPLAYAQAKREGNPIQNGTAFGTKDLRERIAKLAVQFYGEGDQQDQGDATTTQESSSNATQQADKAQLSSEAKAREEKLKQAEKAPPDVSNMGSAASAAGLSEEEILSRLEGMTEEEQVEFLDSMPGFVERVTGAA